MRSVKKCFSTTLATAIAACHCLKLLLTGAVEANDLAQGALRPFTQCRCIWHTTFQLWGGHLTTELSSSQRNLRRECLGVRWCYDATVGRYWGTNDTRKRIKLALTIYRDFMQSLFYQILRAGAIETAALMFACPQPNVISFLCSTDFSLRWWKWLCLARKV